MTGGSAPEPPAQSRHRQRMEAALARLRSASRAYDIGLALAMLTISLVLYLPGIDRVGVHSDDSGFLATLPGAGVQDTLSQAAAYVPGRNLHIVWQRFAYWIGGDFPVDVALQHQIQALLAAVTVSSVFLMCRAFGLGRAASVIGAAIFMAFPNHGETLFWLSAGPMNVMSTLLIVMSITCLALGVRRARRGIRPGIPLAVAFVITAAAAIFTYDQVFVVILGATVVGTAAVLVSPRGRNTPWVYATAPAAVIGVLAADVLVKVSPSSGPAAEVGLLDRIGPNLRVALDVSLGPLFDANQQLTTAPATGSDWVLALTTALLVAGLIVWLMRSGGHTREPATPVPSAPYLGALVCGVGIFIAAYLPAAAWAISPRHNYLPTLGIALFMAGLWGCTWQLVKSESMAMMRWTATAVLIAAPTLALADWGVAVKGEQHYWTESGEIKAQAFRDIDRRARATGASAAVPLGFPATVGTAPFFVQETGNALRVTPGIPPNSTLRELAPSAVKVHDPDGFVLFAEVGRYGDTGARFYGREDVLGVVRRDGERLRVLDWEKWPKSLDVGSTVRVTSRSRTKSTGITQAAVSGRVSERTSRRTRVTLDIAAPGAPGVVSVLAIRIGKATSGTGGWTNSYGESLSVPIPLAIQREAPVQLRATLDISGSLKAGAIIELVRMTTAMPNEALASSRLR